MSDQDAAAPTTRIEVVGGGDPDAATLAALVVALTPVAVAPPASPAASVPAWARAALLEGVGHRRPSRPSDLDALRLG